MKQIPMGDSALLLTELAPGEAAAWARAIRGLELVGVLDVVPAYDEVAIHFSPPFEEMGRLMPAIVDREVRGSESQASPLPSGGEGAGGEGSGCLRQIPVCYELGPDLAIAASELKISVEELVEIHASREYSCWAVGFSPGFGYLGDLDQRIAGLPRLPSPRPRVEPGSVGITGKQTAVYPSATPGGWWLIGQTPLTMVDVESDYFLIETGDRVRFVPISEAEFEAMKGNRL